LQEPDIKKNLSRIIDPKLLSKERYLNLLELRYILEIGIIPLLFENLQEKDISNLYEVLPLSMIKNRDIRLSTEDEIKFHSVIYKIAKNQTLIDLMEIILSMRFRLYDSSEFFIFNQKLNSNNLKATHFDILKALESRDSTLYEDVIKRHLLPYHLYIKEKRENM
jgi:DNA-binding FadR family transcriptional regulator